MTNAQALEALVEAAAYAAHKGYTPATGGNFSIRDSDTEMLMSISGKDKGTLCFEDFVKCDFQGNALEAHKKPSAEASLHGMIYTLSSANSVLHTHSVATTVLSLLMEKKPYLHIQGYEMQKVIEGVTSHEDTLNIAIFDNDQNIARLADEVKARWQTVQKAHGLMVRGHGLYSWGKTVTDAKRHMEGLEFLIHCELTKIKCKNT